MEDNRKYFFYPNLKPKKKKKTPNKRLNRKRKTPMALLERKAWKVFSLWIRLRDAKQSGSVGLDWLKCYTCNKDILLKEAEAGHFIPRGVKLWKFNESNVHSQCTRCNHFLHGNLAVYAMKLKGEYGEELVMAMLFNKHKPHKFTRDELEEIINKYA